MRRILRLFKKGLISVKQHGIRYTLRKVKMKFKVRSEAKKAAKAAKTPAAEPVVNIFELQKSMELPPIEEKIKFSVLVPLYNTKEQLLKEMIESVLDQRYTNFELCLADGSTPECGYVETVCREYAAKDERVRYERLEKNLGISENTNACAKMATGEYIVLFDHDDLMSPIALYENAAAIIDTGADVLYSDEDHITEKGEHISPLYKPDWSRDLLYSQMYVCHLFVFRRELFEKIGGFRKAYDGSQDYDLMLRLSEHTENIVHIPEILYSWRETESSTANNASSKPYAHTAGLNALNDHLKRMYGGKAKAYDGKYTFTFDTRFDTISDKPLVSVIMPMKDYAQLSDDCVKSIIKKTKYQNYEIIILDNRSEKEETFKWFSKIEKFDKRIRVVKADMEFNWSKLNNFGISKAKGEVYIFLNNDIVVDSPDWMERLTENAMRDDVGVVGPLLLYPDKTIQHAGVVIGFGGWADHVYKAAYPVHVGTPYISPMITRNVSAVTGACMAISKKTIEKIGLFDDTFIICGSDVEICVRAYNAGLRNVYAPYAVLYHYESKTRDAKAIPQIDFEKSAACYSQFKESGDPYYNINLDLNSPCPKEKKR